MKPLGIALVRWLVGLLCGLVAAGVLFVLAVLAAGPAAGPALGFIALGFGVALFPAAFTLATRTPRQVLRRGFLALALEGLGLLAEAYLRITGSEVVAQSSLGWLRSLTRAGESVALWPTEMVALGGAVALVAGLVLLFALRPRARRAPSGAPASPRLPSAEKGPAAKPPPAPAGVLPDEDAQLMADLENLRKKLPK